MKKLIFLTPVLEDRRFPIQARKKIEKLLDQLKNGAMLPMPISKPFPDIGKGCHELRILDFWRLVYKIDTDAIVVLEIFPKKTQTMPQSVINTCQTRLKAYLSSKEINKTAGVGNFTTSNLIKLTESGLYAKIYDTSWESVGISKKEHEVNAKTASYKKEVCLLKTCSNLYKIGSKIVNKEIRGQLNKTMYRLGQGFVSY